MISVSRLCCPVCWELLNIILNDSDDEPRLVSFPGCHPIIYPVELPEWLPQHIVTKMTDLFKDHLRTELTSMLKGAEDGARTTQRKQHTSHQSESNISVASTNRNIDGDTDFEEWSGAVKD
jgi:hypothetical protein